MDRRGFLTFVGAYAAGAALPKALRAEKIVKAPHWATEGMIVVYRSSVPLESGNYTFTAGCWKGSEYMGWYCGGVKAEGGETLFEMPVKGYTLTAPRLNKGDVVIGWDYIRPGSIEFTEQTLQETPRGNGVEPA